MRRARTSARAAGVNVAVQLGIVILPGDWAQSSARSIMQWEDAGARGISGRNPNSADRSGPAPSGRDAVLRVDVTAKRHEIEHRLAVELAIVRN